MAAYTKKYKNPMITLLTGRKLTLSNMCPYPTSPTCGAGLRRKSSAIVQATDKQQPRKQKPMRNLGKGRNFHDCVEMLQDYFRIEDTDKVSGVYFTIPQEDKQWSSKYADVDLGKELYNIRRNKEYYKEEYPEDYNKQLLDLALFEPNMRGASSMRN